MELGVPEGIIVFDDNSLVPHGQLSRALPEGGLLERMLASEIKQEANIEIPDDDDVPNIFEALGVSGDDVDGAIHCCDESCTCDRLWGSVRCCAKRRIGEHPRTLNFPPCSQGVR